MADKPYIHLIHRYFPASEWDAAECIIGQECPEDISGWPYGCIRYQGWMTCGTDPTPREARAYGMFGILDVCYDPAMNPESPFTPYQWQAVLDPNVNTWMASVIWSNAGWRAWTSCPACNCCDVLGEPIPYPRVPLTSYQNQQRLGGCGRWRYRRSWVCRYCQTPETEGRIMASSPYYRFIQTYFPPAQHANADCISTHECSPSRAGYPGSCVGPEGWLSCSGQLPYVNAASYGPFQILDACWNPSINSRSPFTVEQWSKVLDPNVNTWMASIIWSRSGWHAWSTAAGCGIDGVPGGAIPHPEGPVPDPQCTDCSCRDCPEPENSSALLVVLGVEW